MNENLLHALAHCSHARQFWIAAADRFQLCLPRLHSDTWAHDILMDSQFVEEDRCRIIMIMTTYGHHTTVGLVIAMATIQFGP